MERASSTRLSARISSRGTGFIDFLRFVCALRRMPLVWHGKSVCTVLADWLVFVLCACKRPAECQGRIARPCKVALSKWMPRYRRWPSSFCSPRCTCFCWSWKVTTHLLHRWCTVQVLKMRSLLGRLTYGSLRVDLARPTCEAAIYTAVTAHRLVVCTAPLGSPVTNMILHALNHV